MKITSHHIAVFVLIAFIGYIFYPKDTRKQEVVNVYTWYGVIDEQIIEKFTQETGIRVNIDYYDNNEILEARLLASNSGYDVVFPSISPFVALQIQAGVYQKLDHAKLTNLNRIDPLMVQKTHTIDPGLKYAVPYFWGTTGFLINLKKLAIDVKDGEVSLKQIFNLKNFKKFYTHGITLLEESIDVLPVVNVTLDIPPNSKEDEDLHKAIGFLKRLRPYIRRFASSRTVHDVANGEIALAMTWSSYAEQVMEESEQTRKNYVYVVPAEGTLMWIDCMAIPKGAPHTKNAYKFINFMLRPDIAAMSTLHSHMATAIPQAKNFLPKAVVENQVTFPAQRIIQKSFLNIPPKTSDERAFAHKANRQWGLVKQGESIHE